MNPGVAAFTVCLALGLAGCATRSADVVPLPASPAEFTTWDCARVIATYDSRLSSLAVSLRPNASTAL